jgi:hypothetical protein
MDRLRERTRARERSTRAAVREAFGPAVASVASIRAEAAEIEALAFESEDDEERTRFWATRARALDEALRNATRFYRRALEIAGEMDAMRDRERNEESAAVDV